MDIINANIKFIRKQKSMTQQKFADYIGIKRSSLGAYEEGRAKPNYDTVNRISEKFNITLDKLLKSNLSAIADESVFGLSNNNRNLETKKISTTKNVSDIAGKDLRILPITVDKEGNENIELVPEKAAAGYLTGYANPNYIKDLPKFRLPFLPTGTYRAFEIVGESMLPLPSGSIVVGEYVEDWQNIKNGQTYIVVSKEEGIVYKRVTNTIAENKRLILKSDNTDYPAYTIKIDEVVEVWKSQVFISKDMPSTDTTLEKLMSTVMELQQEVIKLKDAK
ncbi:MAG: XRE family transcriptional regulator [Chitinophagales bacterium]